jgi:hypothetical protein
MLHLLDPIEISNIIKHESTKNELKTNDKSGSSITGMYIKEKSYLCQKQNTITYKTWMIKMYQTMGNYLPISETKKQISLCNHFSSH